MMPNILFMSNDRIIELEIKAAYQEDLLQELNTIVSAQQQQIQRLEATCQLLNERIKILSTEGAGGGESIDEVPPHY
jgi:SlyX protein